PRDFFLFELRKFSGTAREYPLPSRRQEQDGIPAHLERQRVSSWTYLGCRRGELSASRWYRAHSGGAAAVYGHRSHPGTCPVIGDSLFQSKNEPEGGVWMV